MVKRKYFPSKKSFNVETINFTEKTKTKRIEVALLGFCQPGREDQSCKARFRNVPWVPTRGVQTDGSCVCGGGGGGGGAKKSWAVSPGGV